MKLLIAVNLVFALLLAVFLILPITENVAWLVLIGGWFLAEAWLSRDTSIKWWQWLLLFLCLGVLDAGIVILLR